MGTSSWAHRADHARFASITMQPEFYPTNLHARERVRARNGNGNRQPAAPGCRRGRGARAALHSRASRRAAASESLAPRRDDRRNGRVRSTASTSRPTDRSLCAPISTSVPISTRPSTRSRTADCSRSSTSANAQPVPPKRVKVQCAGPLTLGGRAVDAGADSDTAFALGARAARLWAARSRSSSRAAFPARQCSVVFDEPALVKWAPLASSTPIRRPRDRYRSAVERARRAAPASPAVHVCGRGDLRLALDAGPRLVHFDVAALDLDDAVAAVALPRGRRLGRSGARSRPHRPVGEHAAPIWKSAARHVVRADAARLRPGRGSGRRRWSHRRAVSPVTA